MFTLLGTTGLTTSGAWTFTNNVTIKEDTETLLGMTAYSSAGVSYSPIIRMTRYDGSEAIPVIVIDGDRLGTIQFCAWDGNSVTYVGDIFCKVDGTPGDGDMPTRLEFWTTPNGSETAVERMRIDNAGIITMNAYGAGAATFSAAGVISSVSDERLKDIQGNFILGLAEILQINPINYKWKKEAGMGDEENVYAGFSAQNVMKYIPEAVGKNLEGYYSFSDRPVIAALVNSIKTLQEEINELRVAMKLLPKAYNTTPITDEKRIVDSAKVIKDKITID
jgi:hypothetical protein